MNGSKLHTFFFVYVDYNNRNVSMKKILLFLSFVAVLSACTDEPVAVKVESIVFNLDVIQLTVGDSQRIEAVVLPDKAENKTLYWSSSNNSVATVTDGVVSALSSGESVITAISEDGGKKASCTVIVTPEMIPVTGITIDRENLRIFIGNKHTLVAIVAPADASNKQVIWSSSDESIATVDEGVVTGVGLGNARITAETKEKGFKVECNVKVTEECQTQTKGPMTLDLGHVTATTAVIAGYLDVDLLADYDMTGGGVGFMYAPASEDFNISTAKKVQISNVDSENSFSHTLTGLSYDSQYQYTIFLYKNGILQLGETQTFKTNDVQILVENVAVTNTTATMSGSVVRSEADTEVKVGIMCSSTNSFSSNTKISKEVIPSDDGAYTLSFDKLDVDKEYYYRTYVYHKGIYEYGDVFTFTTNGISVDLDVKSKTQTTAMFTGKLLPSTAIDEATIGILVNTSRSVSNNSYSKRFILSSEIVNSDGTFSFAISELKSNTTYYYTYYTLNNGKYTYGDISEFKTDEVQVSLLVANTTQTTATFTGNVFLTEKDEVEVGLVYSSTSSSPTVNNSSRILLSDIIDSDGAFSYRVDGLMNGRKHYYRYYLKQNGSYTYGDVLEFQTDVVPVTLSVDNITQTTATFIGEAIFTEKGAIEIGLVYSATISSPMVDNSEKIVLTGIMDAEGVYTCKIEGLLNGTEYYYRYYVEQNGSYTYGAVKELKTDVVPIIVSVDNVTQTAVKFSGKVELTENNQIEVGILYSKECCLTVEANGVIKQNIIPDIDGNILFEIADLQFNTNYYYCYYICQQGKYIYGPSNNIKTLNVEVILNVDTITYTDVTFNGSVKIDESNQIKIGILYSKEQTITIDGCNVYKGEITPDASGGFVFVANDLQFATTYNYCYYISQNGAYVYGDMFSFTTSDIKNDLSKDGTANSYLVSQPGVYKFKTVKGNSSVSIGNINEVVVLWESFGSSVKPSVGDLIIPISFNDDYIGFKTPSLLKEGNAVIAVKDISGGILWSWHIWLTDAPKEQVYFNDAGIMMDRNLGATSSAPGDVESLGLLYQWGRKDPFLGSSSITSFIQAKSTIAWPDAVCNNYDKGNGTITYSIAHPTTYIYVKDVMYAVLDWYYADYAGNTDVTRWRSGAKTIYDPCPVGWRVPEGGSNGVWAKALGTSKTINLLYDSVNCGFNLSGKLGEDHTIWYPSFYFYDFTHDPIYSVMHGHCWSASASSGDDSYGLYYIDHGNSSSYIYPTNAYPRATSAAVRCVKE